MEEEIDLRPYILALARNWYWIIGAAVATAVIAFGVSSLRPETYEAQAVVAIVRSRTDVSFDPRIETEEDVLGSRDVRSRQTALVALVKTNDLATAVLDRLGEELPPELRNVSRLSGLVTSANDGDLINVTVTYRDPEMAARIANAWAEAYVADINRLYAIREGSPAVIEGQVAQAALEAFGAEEPSYLVQQEISATLSLMDSYQAARDLMQRDPIDARVQAQQALLAQYYANLANIDLWLADAEALLNQVNQSGGSDAANLGDYLALVELRGRAVRGLGEGITLRLDVGNEPAAEVTPEDVAAVITVLQDHRQALVERIAASSADLATATPEEMAVADDHPVNQRLEALSRELQLLQAEYAAEEARANELTQARDLAWETLVALENKQQEAEIAAGSAGTEVRLASSAAVPQTPTGTERLLTTALAGIVGGMLAVFAVTAVFWWRGEGEVDGG